jgi:hypothetical protein
MVEVGLLETNPWD